MLIVLLHLFVIVSLVASAQQPETVYKSVYQINGADLSFSVPDTATKQLGIQEKVKLPVGAIKYFNTYGDGFSRLRIAFVANAGFSGLDASDYVIYTDVKAKTYSLYKDDNFIRCVKYELPLFTSAGDSAVVNGYTAKPYQYVGKDSLKAVIWFSKTLPAGVNPGLAFDGYGGVVKIAYSLNGQHWSLDLVSIGKAEGGVVKDKQNQKLASSTREPHFLFHPDEE